jgi:hypothetical protein
MVADAGRTARDTVAAVTALRAFACPVPPQPLSKRRDVPTAKIDKTPEKPSLERILWGPRVGSRFREQFSQPN